MKKKEEEKEEEIARKDRSELKRKIYYSPIDEDELHFARVALTHVSLNVATDGLTSTTTTHCASPQLRNLAPIQSSISATRQSSRSSFTLYYCCCCCYYSIHHKKKKKKNSPPKNRRPEQPSIAGNEHKSGSMLISGGVYVSFPFLSFRFEGERSVGTKNRRNPRGRSACFGSSRGRSLSSEHPSGPLTIISAVRVRQQPLTHWSMPTHAASLSPFLVPLTPRERPHSFRERSPVSVRPTTLRSPLPLALTLCLFSSLALFLLRSSLSLYLPPDP